MTSGSGARLLRACGPFGGLPDNLPNFLEARGERCLTLNDLGDDRQSGRCAAGLAALLAAFPPDIFRLCFLCTQLALPVCVEIACH